MSFGYVSKILNFCYVKFLKSCLSFQTNLALLKNYTCFQKKYPYRKDIKISSIFLFSHGMSHLNIGHFCVDFLKFYFFSICFSLIGYFLATIDPMQCCRKFSELFFKTIFLSFLTAALENSLFLQKISNSKTVNCIKNHVKYFSTGNSIWNQKFKSSQFFSLLVKAWKIAYGNPKHIQIQKNIYLKWYYYPICFFMKDKLKKCSNCLRV